MHQTELFGPVLAVMRAKNLDEAIRFANGTPYGLTSGIHTLDKRESSVWIKKIEAGNCYVNRGITGAVVERQPFGGCKASNFGHGSKAGGPNYVAQFMHKKQIALPKEKSPVNNFINKLTTFLNQLDLSAEDLGIWFASTANYAYYAKIFAKDHDPQKVLGQDNILRFVPRKRMGFRIQKGDSPLDIFRVIAAAISCKCHIEISYDPNECSVNFDTQWKQTFQQISFSEKTLEEFIARLQWGGFERVRFVNKPPIEVARAASESGIYLNSEPVLASGKVELTHYLREVALSIDYHRYGNLGTREGEIRSEIL